MAAPDFAYRIAETREEVEGAVRLVYRNYIELKYCRLNRFEVHFYLYDVLPETRTLVALHGDRVVATLTLVFDSPLGLPSGKLYPAELEALRRDGRRLAEVSKLAVDRDLGARGLTVLKGLFRLGWLTAGRVRGCTDLAIMVEPHHERFYARSLLFERAGELKPDPEAADAPSVLLRLRLAGGPERYRAAFGEDPRESNPYWYFCQAPGVSDIEAAAREADERLQDMHRLLETGRKLPNPTSAERRYMDYRLFAIAFVTDKTCREAEQRAQKGLFRDEIEAYDRLLAALPPDYAPERRAGIYVDIAEAARHCGLYERALALAGAARELAVSADLKAAGHRISAAALHFLARGEEALAEIRAGLALPGVGGLARGRLLLLDGRLAIERFDLAAARASLQQARAVGESLPSRPQVAKFLAQTLHTLCLVETNGGDLAAARDALRAGGPHLAGADRMLIGQYHAAWCHTEAYLGHPRESLAHAEMGLRQIDPASNPYNAVILVRARGNAHLAMGDLAAALEDGRRETELAERSRFPALLVYAACQRAILLAAEDRLAEARREMGAAPAAQGGMLPLAEINRLHALAHLSALERDWARARELRGLIAERTRGVPLYDAVSRQECLQVELLAGDPSAARRLAAGAPTPDRMRGFATYEALWKSNQAVLAAADGDEGRALLLAGEALAIHRAGEAAHDLAGRALTMAEALRSCRLADGHRRLHDFLRDAAAEVCAALRLPACARRLRELG